MPALARSAPSRLDRTTKPGERTSRTWTEKLPSENDIDAHASDREVCPSDPELQPALVPSNLELTSKICVLLHLHLHSQVEMQKDGAPCQSLR